jgi:carbon-monoxide dehydrogenase medium subunit
LSRLKNHTPNHLGVPVVRPARFAYFRPDSVDAAVALLRDNGDQARVLAGGQSLVALMNRRLVRPTALVDVTGLRDLRHLTLADGELRIGALTRHVDVETVRDPEIRSSFAILSESARWVAFHPIRTRGTFGGSIAYADPCSEWCLLAVLLDATVVAVGPDGSRTIDAADFFTGTHRTALSYDEMVVEVRVPRPPRGTALTEFSIRLGDFAVVAAAAAVDVGDGAVTSARIALGGAADRPIRLPDAEKAFVDTGSFDEVARVVADGVAPPSDVNADAAYRRELAATLAVRALREALAKAIGKGDH